MSYGTRDPAQQEAEYNPRRNRLLAATGYAENAAVGNGHLKPGMQVLTKPFPMETLARRIKGIVAENRKPVFMGSCIIRYSQETTVSASQFFSQVAQWTSRQCGRPLTFGLAFGVIVVWAVSGPLFNYSDTWQLVINTATTIVTFLMVFLIQNTQNRDATAVQLKLDELIRASTSARNKLLTLEDLTEAELDQMKKSFARIADRGGIGEGALREVEAGLEEAEEGIEKAKDKIAVSKS
jgi:low affinity Fe/Cu permease